MRKAPQNHDKEWLVYLANTPVGPLRLSFTERGLTALEFAGEEASPAPEHDAPPPHLKPLIEAAKRELIAYFNGSPPISPPSPWTPGAPLSNSGCGRNCAAFPGARPSPTANWPGGWETPRLPGPWARPTRSTPSPSSSPATGSLPATAAWGATVPAWTARTCCSAMKGRGRRGGSRTAPPRCF